ncbi:MAG: DUF72 domain-containing protein [Thermosulfidibacteraceae bacterium]|jgi:uncharacterized protein YecE (DUF72 family)
MVKIGCCGFPVSYKKYFKIFPTVEVQISFYRALSEKQVEGWKRSLPESFEFVFKVPQCVTHPPGSPTYRRSNLKGDEIKECGFFRLSDVVKREMDSFLSLINRLPVKGLLFQTPSRFVYSSENVERMVRFFEYYSFIKEKYLVFWEMRGESWDREAVVNVCSLLGIIHATDPFLSGPQLYGDITYYRLHGNLKTYNYDYSREELLRLKDLCKNEGYVFFNNSCMYKNALEFMEILCGRSGGS